MFRGKPALGKRYSMRAGSRAVVRLLKDMRVVGLSSPGIQHISPLRSCGMAETPEMKAGCQSQTKRYSARTKRRSSHRISGTLYGSGSCATPCRTPSGSSPGVAGFFAEDLIDDRLVDLCVEEKLGIYMVPAQG